MLTVSQAEGLINMETAATPVHTCSFTNLFLLQKHFCQTKIDLKLYYHTENNCSATKNVPLLQINRFRYKIITIKNNFS